MVLSHRLICYADQSGQFHVIYSFHEVGLTDIDKNASAGIENVYNQSDQ